MNFSKTLVAPVVIAISIHSTSAYSSPAKDKYFANECYQMTTRSPFLDPQTLQPMPSGYDSNYGYWPIKTVTFPLINTSMDVIVIEVSKTEKWGDRTTHKSICEIVEGLDTVDYVHFNENGMLNGLHYTDFY